MSTPRLSLWMATAPGKSYPALKGTQEVEVAVIGGGIVGILTAHELKRRGHTVALLEARQLASGVTGYTTAKLTAVHGAIYQKIAKDFDQEAARLYARANLDALDWVEKTARTERITCDFSRRPLFLYVKEKKGQEMLGQEEEAAAKAGLRVEKAEKVDFPYATAALSYPDQAEFHPRSFLLPLAEKIAGKGSFVFENSRVVEIKEGEPCEVRTEQGSIRAQSVVLATMFPVYDPAFYFSRLSPFRDYAIAFTLKEPASENMFVGVDSPSYTVRRYQDLVILGGIGHPVGEGGDTHQYYQQLEDFACEHYALKEVLYSWSAQDYSTLDGMPYIGRISPGSKHAYVATGFAGWGMSTGVVASQLLSDLIEGKSNPYAELYNPNRFKPVTSAKPLVEMGIKSAKHLLLDRLTPATKKQLDSLKPGEACIVETPHGKVAAYKGRGGVIKTLSASCTHMGCVVSWNSAEESWDCPCHGSRFDTDGTVIQGPAVQSLPPTQ